MVNVDSYEINFELSKPFRPIEQLLAVLPADSVKALPESCQQLMLSPDSPIIDIYSRDIPIDPNGKILPWLWVVLLPFIDESRIVSAMQLCEDGMSDEEKRRNTFGTSLMFVHTGHTLGMSSLSYLDYNIECNPEKSSYMFPPTPNIGQGITGLLSVRSDLVKEVGLQEIIRAPSRPLRAFQDIIKNRVLCFEYNFPDESHHQSILLPGVDLGAKVLCDFDGIVSRPKLNKGRFNIADIAERMREERRTGSSQPYQRMIQSGLGKYPTYPASTREDQYPSNPNSLRDSRVIDYEYRDRQSYNSFSRGYPSNYENQYQDRRQPERNFSRPFHGNYDDYSTDRRNSSHHVSQYSHRSSYSSSNQSNRYHQDSPYSFHPPPSYSQPHYTPPPAYSSHHEYQPPFSHSQYDHSSSFQNQFHSDFDHHPSGAQSAPPRSRAPPIPQFPAHANLRAGQNDGAPQSLADLRNQISYPSNQGNRHNSQTFNPRDPRARR